MTASMNFIVNVSKESLAKRRELEALNGRFNKYVGKFDGM